MCYQRCAIFKEVLKYSLQVNKQDFEFAGERQPPCAIEKSAQSIDSKELSVSPLRQRVRKRLILKRLQSCVLAKSYNLLRRHIESIKVATSGWKTKSGSRAAPLQNPAILPEHYSSRMADFVKDKLSCVTHEEIAHAVQATLEKF